MPRFSQRKGCFNIPELPQTIVEAVEQMRDRLLSLIAHVGETKCLALQLAVAAVDHEVMLCAQITHQLGDVDFLGCSSRR